MVYLKSVRNFTWLISKYTTRNVHTSKIPSKLLTYNHSFTSDEQDSIISAFNSWDLTEFTKRNISKLRSLSVIKYRQKYGNFTSLEHLLEVENFGISALEKMCQAIVKKDVTETSIEEPPELNTTFIDPELSTNDHSRVASICFNPEMAACNLLLENGEILIWSEHDLCENTKKIPKFQNVLCKIQEIYHLLLQHNIQILLLEEPNLYHSKLTMYHMLMAQIEAGIVSLFGQHENIHIHTIKPYHIGRLFGTLVLRERVSSYQVVDAILDQSPYVSFKKVFINSSLKEAYRKKSPPKREIMDRAFLLNLSFYELVVMKRRSSIFAALGKVGKPQ